MNETKVERGLQVAANAATILSAARGLTYLVVIIGLPMIALKAIPLLDRAVVVLENMDRRVERAFEGPVPVGREAVGKGIEAVQNVDGKAVGNQLTEAAKRLLRGKKDK